MSQSIRYCSPGPPAVALSDKLTLPVQRERNTQKGNQCQSALHLLPVSINRQDPTVPGTCRNLFTRRQRYMAASWNIIFCTTFACSEFHYL